MRLSVGAALAIAALLAATIARDAGPPRLSLSLVGYDWLDGWANDHLSAAVPAFLRSCVRFLSLEEADPLNAGPISRNFGRLGDWRAICRAARTVPPDDDAASRRFFESGFVPYSVGDFGVCEGLFTGYFEIELNGSWERQGQYQTPIYRRPIDPGLATRYSRAEIEDGALVGRGLELLWLDDPIAAFFLQIQGSGRVRLGDGTIIGVGYDGRNGWPYVGVGRLLVDRGIIPSAELTMNAIWEWMKRHPEAGSGLRRENPSYVFFRKVFGDGPVGTEEVVLTPGRSLAVDRAFIPLGIPIWIEAEERFAFGEKFRHLMIAQDTGGAIEGPVRGDIFWGTGSVAAWRAGTMNARGRYYLLLPRAVTSEPSG